MKYLKNLALLNGKIQHVKQIFPITTNSKAPKSIGLIHESTDSTNPNKSCKLRKSTYKQLTAIQNEQLLQRLSNEEVL